MRTHSHSLKEKRHSLIIAGQRLSYRTLGAGPPLVMLHGYGVSGSLWLPTLPYLAQRHEVFVLDLPGHGHSSLSAPWQLRAVAPVVAQWLTSMQLAPIALLGQSMGGAIALQLTAENPGSVRQLILVSAAGLPLGVTLPQLAGRSVRSFFQHQNGRYPLALIRDMLHPRFRLLWRAAQEIVASDFRAEIAAVAKLVLPVLIIWGEEDILLPISLGYQLHAALPHATFVTLPRCGHRPMLAQPEKFSSIILQFLQTSQ
jgi:pimeloyl-ACP methyl ester carboxylesterase